MRSTNSMPIPEQSTKRRINLSALHFLSRPGPNHVFSSTLRDHFKGALEAGTTVKELSFILALIMREAAGIDNCWTHDVIGDWKEILEDNVCYSCAGDEDPE
ncbi:hypothetical protein [Methanolobus halotolerans]|uniref:hypothetical protein n=1 Tax=Methanolobus halotolerans TaxID=2052935 RepID=UPI001F26A583|nr:hypothetical protein [Methanolobus halotolerans]